MNPERVQRLLKQKENIRLEFKEAKTTLPGNLFETICAMLNRDGGDILLGVDDDGMVTGIDETAVNTMVTNLVNLSNNPQKLDPPFILFPQTYTIEGNRLIHIQVPASSQVHKTAQTVFDRSQDGDFRVNQPHRIAEIANRKRNHYTEGIIYPSLRFEDFKAELFPKIRNLIRSYDAQHPWLTLNDAQMLEVAGLWKRDFQSGQEGYTLAGALLLGKNEVIQQIIPHYKIDALVRVEDKLRYDDREYIQTNLVEAYEQLMAFVAKHLPDKFYMESEQRISLRTKIFREVVANLIVHREYTNAAPCTFIIYSNRLETENANNPHGEGPIDPHNFAPFPKNPLIAKFFIQLGRVEELGSGVLNTSRLAKEYAGGGKAVFIEGSTFKTLVPLPEQRTTEISGIDDTVNDTVNDTSDTVNDTVKQRLAAMIRFIIDQPGIKKQELSRKLKVSEITIKRDMQRIRKLVEFRGTQKTGGYYLTDYMQAKLPFNN
ncbi:MAG TPA: RNA-binding domain-containing protein [Puia sp.]|nr:RNA-binding domain-containing protein [Puia sp.]